MIPVLRNVLYINEYYVQDTRKFVRCDIDRSTLCVDKLHHAFFHAV